MKIHSLIIAICLILAPPVWADAKSDFRKGEAAYRLGDYKQAIKYYLKAAKQGDAEAQLALGLVYFIGDGVPQDYKTAFYWFRKAAKQGDASAQSLLGVSYANGMGLPQHNQKAYMWYLLAMANGDAEMKKTVREEIGILESRLSRAEIRAAKKEAAEMQAQIESKK